MFELAGLTEIETYFVDNVGTKIKCEKRLCDIITSHWARHTFITNKLVDGWSEDKLRYCTGHTDNEMIKRIYSHLTQDGKIKMVVDEIERLENQQTESTTNAKELIELGKKQRENEDIREFKDVLIYLGEKYEDIADITDVHTLSKLVFANHYKTISKWGIKSDVLKETFQRKDLTLKEKKELLEKMKEITKAKERIQAEKDINTM